MIANAFHDVFWPTLWATLAGALVGVAGGIPVGLALDSLRRKSEDATARKEERARIDHVLRVMKKGVDDIAGRLRGFQEMIKGDDLVIGLRISTAVWDSLGQDVARGLTAEPELLAALWDFFDGISSLMEMHQRRLDSMIGLAAALGSAERVAEAIRGKAVEESAGLIKKAEALAREFDKRAAAGG